MRLIYTQFIDSYCSIEVRWGCLYSFEHLLYGTIKTERQGGIDFVPSRKVGIYLCSDPDGPNRSLDVNESSWKMCS